MLLSSSIRLLANQTIKTAIIYSQTRTGVWQSDHIDPIVNKEKLYELDKNGQLKELMFKPVKAALNEHRNSLFQDDHLDLFIKICMQKGKKANMVIQMKETFANIKRIQLDKYYEAKTDEERAEIELDPLVIFHKAVQNCLPLLITKPVKRGGATYQVPYPLKPREQLILGMKWIRDIIRERPKPRTTHFPEELSKELIDAYYNEGKAVRKKQDVHKLAEANKAYSHYRWG